MIDSIKNHILSEYPNEACGIIVNGDYIPCKNTSDDPSNSFKISVGDYSKHLIDGSLQAVVHSHPFAIHPLNRKLDPRTPSTKDQESWIALNVPFIIFNTNGVEVSEPLVLDDSVIQPLEGRKFVHGWTDCGAIVRDYYRLNFGINLPRIARGWEWWESGKTLYEDNWVSAGFVEVPQEDIRIGDVVLMQVACSTINHAAVYCDNNKIIHHLFHRLSGYDTLSKYYKQIRRVIRHQSRT